MPVLPFTCMHDCQFCLVSYCPTRDMKIQSISSQDTAGLVVTDTEIKQITDFAPEINVNNYSHAD